MKGGEHIDSRIDHPCPICSHADGLLMTVHIDEIPYFGEHTQVTLACESCGWRKTDFIPAEARGPTGHRLIVNSEHLDARVIRSSSCTVRIPALGLEVEPGSAASGYVSNVEGVFIRFRDTMMMMERGHDPEYDATENLEKIQHILSILEQILSGEDCTMELILLDPLGHSGILHADTETWSLSEEEVDALAVGPEIPVFEVGKD
ncbi:MAG: ZPR1 zinc finger domain-containing protein [Candidatus Thermoplasmatota archaeon]|nr:ZPR1 zinc finger domain-containing protein [Candidatus Thermoplasmatota archaeon]